MTVIIGVDPHKATHTAVAIDRDERPLARLQLVADRCQIRAAVGLGGTVGRNGPGRSSRPRGWANCWPSSSRAGEHVVTCRRRCPRGCGCWARPRQRRTTPTTRWPPPSRGYGTASSAGRVEDHATVIRLLIDRYDDLVSLPTQATCRLHVVLRELIAGGAPRRLALTGPPSCCAASARWWSRSSANGSQSICWPTSGASTATSPPPNAASPTLSTAPGRRCSSCTVSARSSPPSSSATSATRPASPPATVRFLQRHRPHRGVQRAPQATPAQPPRQPQAQPRHAPHRRHPDPQRHPRPRLLPAQARRGQVEEGSAACPEAAHQRRRLAPAPSRSRPPLTQRAREDNQGRL